MDDTIRSENIMENRVGVKVDRVALSSEANSDYLSEFRTVFGFEESWNSTMSETSTSGVK
jgi:hypothetical protein